MNITENVNTAITMTPGLDYGFSVSGEYGGGSVSLEWQDEEGNWTEYDGASLVEVGSIRVRAISHRARIVVANTVELI